VSESDPLSRLILSKLEGQIEQTAHLLTLIPDDKLEWQPLPNVMRVCDLLGHLLECLAGFCATLYAIDRKRLAHFDQLRNLTVNHACAIQEASERIGEYASNIREGFSVISDYDLARRIPTIFAPEGEAVMTILLDNLEHLINHKHQLFFYLKLIGVNVGTGDLYKLKTD
jgi:hypothetical protein